MDEAVVGDEVSLRNKEDFLQMNLQNQPFVVSQHTRCLCPHRAGPVSQGVSTKPGRVPARNTQRGADNVSQAMYPH